MTPLERAWRSPFLPRIFAFSIGDVGEFHNVRILSSSCCAAASLALREVGLFRRLAVHWYWFSMTKCHGVNVLPDRMDVICSAWAPNNHLVVVSSSCGAQSDTVFISILSSRGELIRRWSLLPHVSPECHADIGFLDSVRFTVVACGGMKSVTSWNLDGSLQFYSFLQIPNLQISESPSLSPDCHKCAIAVVGKRPTVSCFESRSGKLLWKASDCLQDCIRVNIIKFCKAGCLVASTASICLLDENSGGLLAKIKCSRAENVGTISLDGRYFVTPLRIVRIGNGSPFLTESSYFDHPEAASSIAQNPVSGQVFKFRDETKISRPGDRQDLVNDVMGRVDLFVGTRFVKSIWMTYASRAVFSSDGCLLATWSSDSLCITSIPAAFEQDTFAKLQYYPSITESK